MKKILIIIPAILIILLNSSFALELVEEAQKQQLLQSALEQIQEGANPTFINIETTVYYSPSFELDHQGQWCSAANEGVCLTTTDEIKEFYDHNQRIMECIDERRAGWCCINRADRGAYEDVRCQGSMVVSEGEYKGVYQFNTVETTLEDSTRIPSKFTRGRTATGTDPQRMWTVAVNPDEGTPGFIPYGTIMYIYWGEGNEWNGLYRAEDTGSAFRGQRKMDIYAGVGREQLNEAERAGLSKARPRIYLLDERGRVIDARTASSSNILTSEGQITNPYSSQTTTQTTPKIFESIREFINDIESCGISCLEEKIQEHSTKELVFSANCPGPKPSQNDLGLAPLSPTLEDNILESQRQIERKVGSLANQMADCLTANQEECLCQTKTNRVSNITFENSNIIFEDQTFRTTLNIKYPQETRGKYFGNYTFIKQKENLTHIVIEDFSPGIQPPIPTTIYPIQDDDEEDEIPICNPRKTHKTICVHNQITDPLTFVVALDN
ncbi:MAG: 3D domain-containing protein [Candidatus Woesearchaeota archaeon]